GIACCGIIYLFVQDELAYDDFHPEADQLYQVLYHSTTGWDFASIPPPVSLAAQEYIPEVEAAARFLGRNISVDVEIPGEADKEFEESIYFADSNFYQIFQLDMVAGQAEHALDDPNALLLSREKAVQFFGTDQVLGRTLSLQGEHLFEVVGVFENWPEQSHISLEMLAPYYSQFRIESVEAAPQLANALETNWLISHSLTYLRLAPGADADKVGEQLTGFVDEYAAEVYKQDQEFSLAPVQDLHLKWPDLALQADAPSNMRYVYTFAAIALITLLIACFNFINLSTAHSARRAREVGMRKSLGATRKQLFFQYLGESLVITFLGFVLAIILMSEGVPLLNRLTGKELSISLLWQPMTILAMLGIFLVTGLLGGSYPAFVLTRLHTITSLKGKTETQPRVFSLRRVLVAFQFAMSIALITGSVIIYFQLDYLLNKPLGFIKENVVTIPVRSNSINNIFGMGMQSIMDRLKTLNGELEAHPDVVATSITGGIPGQGSIMHMMTYEGQPAEEGPTAISDMSVDYTFLETYGIEVLAGRGFSRDAGTDQQEAFMINETGVRQLGWETPEEALGKQVTKVGGGGGKQGTVIGVFKDFHYIALSQPINALFLDISANELSNLSVRIREGADYQATLGFLEDKWTEFFPEKTFEYFFLEETLAQNYQNEDRLGEIMRWFAILAIFVSCLGSYGLILFHAKRREKEIGVRKVLGASVRKLMFLLFREFTLLYAIGLVISVGLVYWLAQQYLSDFEYRIGLSPAYFILGGGLTLAIIWSTIGFRSYRAATANPIKALRDD
ncbi:MAG: FtsX-like permease family protein, partial [Bacteroidota bacterium]